MHNNPLQLLVALLGVGAAFFFLERMFPSVLGKRFFRKGFGTDLAYWFTTPFIVGGILEALGTALISLAVWLKADFISEIVANGAINISSLPLFIQVSLGLFLGDLVNYAQHRLFHGRRLWRFHAIHHSSTELDWLSAVRLHPINNLGARGSQALFLILMGFDPAAVAIAVPIIYLYAIFLHANIDTDFGPFRYIIGSPVYHRWHHTSVREGGMKNYASMFPVWDILFGTFYMPRDWKPQDFGRDAPMKEDFLYQMAYPFLPRAKNANAAENREEI